MERFINEKLVNEKLKKMEELNDFWNKKYLEEKEAYEHYKDMYLRSRKRATRFAQAYWKERKKNEDIIKYINSYNTELMHKIKEIKERK